MGIGGVAAKDMRDGDVIFSLPLESRDAMTGEYTPLALTTELVRAVGGPLGECGRALAVTGAGRCSGRHIIRLTPGALKALEFNFLKSTMLSKPLVSNINPAAPYTGAARKLAGVQESDHDFPLNSTHVSLLALALVHQAAAGRERDAHWHAYVDLLPREVGRCKLLTPA